MPEDGATDIERTCPVTGIEYLFLAYSLQKQGKIKVSPFCSEVHTEPVAGERVSQDGTVIIIHHLIRDSIRSAQVPVPDIPGFHVCPFPVYRNAINLKKNGLKVLEKCTSNKSNI
jgi:hypothetical protein